MCDSIVKLIIVMFVFGMIMPVFADEPMLNDVQTQLDNQINQENLEKLEQRISNIESQGKQNYVQNFELWLVIGTFLAVAVAFWGNYRAGNQLKKQNTISEEQNRLAKRNIEYQGILEAMKIFNDDQNAKNRDSIYEQYRNETLYNSEGDIPTELDKFYVASVRGMFDNMGKLVDEGYVNKEQFLSMYCGSIIRMYKVLKRHVEYERKKRKSKHFAVYFEKIYDESRKYWKNKFPDTPEPEPY